MNQAPEIWGDFTPLNTLTADLEKLHHAMAQFVEDVKKRIEKGLIWIR